MTDDEIHAARLAAAALFATHAPAAHVVSRLFHALDDLERATAEVERLRAAVAAGDRLAEAAGATFDYLPDHIIAYGVLEAALDAWEAARRGKPTP